MWVCARLCRICSWLQLNICRVSTDLSVKIWKEHGKQRLRSYISFKWDNMIPAENFTNPIFWKVNCNAFTSPTLQGPHVEGNEATWLRGSSALRHWRRMGGISEERGQLVVKYKRERETSTLQKTSSVVCSDCEALQFRFCVVKHSCTKVPGFLHFNQFLDDQGSRRTWLT